MAEPAPIAFTRTFGRAMSSTKLNGQRARPADPQAPPKIETAQLMQGRREILIQHGSQQYRLRITSAGKLILTK